MKICVIPGDGIGPEVLAGPLAALQRLLPQAEFSEHEAGFACFERHGTALPAATLAAARAADAILFGASGSPLQRVEGFSSPIVALRRHLDLFANLRPVRSESADLVVVRENTEGLYAGRERLEDHGETAIAERVITRRASARIVRTACELALSRPARHLTLVHKANVLRVSDGLFRETALAICADYPDLRVDELLVDVAAMHLAREPRRFDVLVTTNLFGDILSDIAVIHGGGLGLAPSANFGERRALFEPVHGSAPDIAGLGIANPLAAFRCAAMLLAWGAQRSLAPATAAARLEAAIAHVLAHGPLPRDLGGNASTAAINAAILDQLG